MVSNEDMIIISVGSVVLEVTLLGNNYDSGHNFCLVTNLTERSTETSSYIDNTLCDH